METSASESGYPIRLRLCIALLGLIAASLAVTFPVAGWPSGNIWVVAFLALVAATAERGRVKLTNSTEVSISLVPTLFAAVLFGPVASLLVAASSFLADLRRPYLKWLSYTSSRAIAGCLAGVAAFEVPTPGHTFARLTIATVSSAAVAGSLDLGFVILVGSLRGLRPRELARIFGPPNALSLPLYAPLVAGLAFSYRALSPWTLLLFFVPALAAQRLFGLYRSQRLLAENLSAVNQRLERANISFATALVATLDARDRYTAGHSAAVAIYARDIASRLGLREDEQQLAHLCGLVHDIGKIGLPPGLLEKPGPLTLDERRQMEQHSEIGERILAKVEDYAEIARIVRHHHERWDGKGYPDRLAGESIPLVSRIIGVADAYNAMTSDRPYREAMPSSVARLRLAQGVETQFDTTVVAAFEAILAAATENYRMATRGDFKLTEQDVYAEQLADVA
jgi:putative nucleotidyltransferase with HDIG domain